MTSPVLTQQFAGEGVRRTIPFDYSFQFDLQGAGRVLKQSVDVSVEAAFTAVSIGYGVVPQIQSIEFGPDPGEMSAGNQLGNISLASVMSSATRLLTNSSSVVRGQPVGDAVLLQGIRLNPAVASIALLQAPLTDRVASRLFRLAGSGSSEIQFLYALTDEGTGRSFQSEPILNTAGLGISNGDRPFRHFHPPVDFAARSKISLEITEVSNFVGRLYVSLQGYKVLGAYDTPTGRALAGTQQHAATRGRR